MIAVNGNIFYALAFLCRSVNHEKVSVMLILQPLKKCESAGVGQPPLLSPPASLNFLSLAASAPATPGSKSGRLLGIFTLFERSQYIIPIIEADKGYDA